ncbi:hypothetical protein AB0M87_04635 [Streptomyces sp. NPDC051320]|uniref:hypothetical protein n=1 Tax=Streptomyces sp. NPDC051320 TaxID=3154644 RepID=UPI0034294B93
MSEPRIISNATYWPYIVRDPERLKEIQTWLLANGINPDDIPVDATVTIESKDPEGGQIIRHTVCLLKDGHKYEDPSTPGKLATEERTTLLTVAPPTHWGFDIPQQPAPEFARGFRLHTKDGHALDGAEFPSGRTYVIDDPHYGFATVAISVEDLLKSYHGARIEWPDDTQAAAEQDQAAPTDDTAAPEASDA